MKPGGIILGEGWTDRAGRKYADCMVWGTLTLDAKESCLKKPKIEFRVRYRKKQFLHCVIWEGSPFYETARTLRMGDLVIIIGQMIKSTYIVKNGVQKERYELNVNFIIPGLSIYDIGAVNAHRVAKFKDPDPFESDGDYDDDEADAPDF